MYVLYVYPLDSTTEYLVQVMMICKFSAQHPHFLLSARADLFFLHLCWHAEQP